MPVEWPIAAEAADHPVDPARRAGRDRLPIVRRDLFLDESARLTEQERALMSAMLGTLIDQIADEVRLGLGPDILPAAERNHETMVPRLWRSGLLDRPILIELLMARVDEQRIAAACSVSSASVVEQLVGDEDGQIASAAMALAIARGRRRDRFGRIGLELDDLPVEEAAFLVYLVAAAVRHQLGGAAVATDDALANAAARVLSGHGEARQTETRVGELAAALVNARGPDDAMIADLASEGDAALLAALCSARAGISPASGWLLLVNGGVGEALLLARLAGLSRPTAATLIATFGQILQWGDPGKAIAWYDSPSDADIEAARGWWRLPRQYRDCFSLIGGRDGQPTD